MQFPERDLTNQYISSSYQDVVQKYNATGSTTYILDGVGNVILSIPTASVGQTLVTQDQTINSSSYSNISSLAYVADVALLADTASLSDYTISSSYALTTSFSQGFPSIKSNFIVSTSFQGQPYTASVVFNNPFGSDYSLAFSCDDAIIFTVDSKSLGGFTVNSNSDVLFSGSLYWQAIIYGEFN